MPSRGDRIPGLQTLLAQYREIDLRRDEITGQCLEIFAAPEAIGFRLQRSRMEEPGVSE